jgi:tetratricopeptide (TPR) repeat protein
MPEIYSMDTFEERVNIILDELALGTQWERSSLILAVYRSEQIKNQVQAALIKSLRKSRQDVLNYSVDKRHYDIPLELLEHPRHGRVVFFVSGLRWGGGLGYSNAYRALNMHREYLVEGNIKAVFWLAINEAKQLARFSPDFWAFRHKVVEFLDLPPLKNEKGSESSFGSFHIIYSKKNKDFQGMIDNAERFYTLGCPDEAILNFRKALRKYPNEIAIELQIAQIYLSMGRLQAAGRILNKLKKKRTIKGNSIKELERLNRFARTLQPAQGGFLEQPAK